MVLAIRPKSLLVRYLARRHGAIRVARHAGRGEEDELADTRGIAEGVCDAEVTPKRVAD